jgi:glycosyltransferase involved in cell wall biosynthesis
MELPLVSILMTCYNRDKYIGAAIESVLASEYSNFELIIVDDHSADKTVNIAKGYAEKDERVKVHVNEKNLGDYPNRNKAASHAKGEFLKYVDSDDYLYPWGLGILVDSMNKFPDSGWGLCSLPQNKKGPFPFVLTPKEAYEYHYLGPGLFHKAPLSSIIRKKVFDEVGGFGSARMVSDCEMWHRLALKYNVVLMNEGIVWSREHNEQEQNSLSKFDLDYERIMIRYLKSPDCPLSHDVASKILRKNKGKNIIGILKSMAKLQPDKAKLGWKKLRSYE